jgi:hypothetical protein
MEAINIVIAPTLLGRSRCESLCEFTIFTPSVRAHTSASDTPAPHTYTRLALQRALNTH